MIKKGAGFVIYRNFKDGIKILGLEGPLDKQISLNGKWDIPKGIKEEDEDFWTCAVRECFEEAGLLIMESDCYTQQPFSDSHLTVWLAKSDHDPTIGPNPKSGYFEHLSWCWLNPDEAENNCYSWLVPFIKWARKELKC